MPLKTLTTLAPGGWIYHQKNNEGAYLKPKPTKSMSPFREASMELLKIRVNNKLNRATIAEMMEDLENATCERLGFDPTFCIQKKTPFTFNPIKLFQASAQHLRESAAAVARRASNLTDGLSILKDWFGDGAMPVSAELSQARGDVCTKGFSGGPCPFNKAGYRPIEAAAEIIRHRIEKKNDLSLFVEGEEKLHVCDICFCDLKTKVHVPLDTILDGTPDAMIQKFRDKQPKCWILSELDKQPTPAL